MVGLLPVLYCRKIGGDWNCPVELPYRALNFTSFIYQSEMLTKFQNHGFFFFIFSLKGDLIFLPEVDSIQEEVDILLANGVTKIIALGHSGIDIDLEIARKVRGVDVVVGGHSDTFLYNGNYKGILCGSMVIPWKYRPAFTIMRQYSSVQHHSTRIRIEETVHFLASKKAKSSQTF